MAVLLKIFVGFLVLFFGVILVVATFLTIEDYIKNVKSKKSKLMRMINDDLIPKCIKGMYNVKLLNKDEVKNIEGRISLYLLKSFKENKIQVFELESVNSNIKDKILIIYSLSPRLEGITILKNYQIIEQLGKDSFPSISFFNKPLMSYKTLLDLSL